MLEKISKLTLGADTKGKKIGIREISKIKIYRQRNDERS